MKVSELYDIKRCVPTSCEWSKCSTQVSTERVYNVYRDLWYTMYCKTGEFLDYVSSEHPDKPLLSGLRLQLAQYVEWWQGCSDNVVKEDKHLARAFYEVCHEWLAIIDERLTELGEPQQKAAPAKKSEPCKERAKTYFAKAVKAGYMEKTDTGYKWTFGEPRGAKAKLAYFIKCVYNPDGCSSTPYKSLEALFGVSRLDSITTSTLETKNPQPWRKDIDKLFEQ